FVIELLSLAALAGTVPAGRFSRPRPDLTSRRATHQRVNNAADRIAEEDEARSVAVWRLLSSDCPPELGSSVQPIPSVLVQYWHDHSAIPSDVAECIGTWMRLCRESGVRHLLFGDLSARSFISS